MTWLKVECDLAAKPEVALIAKRTRLDTDTVIGKLIRFWSWADLQTLKSNAPTVTRETLDAFLDVPGFADAMLAANWLQEASGSLRIVNQDRHIGQQARARAVQSARSMKHRTTKGQTLKSNAPTVTRETFERPPWIPAEPWAAWLEVRKRIGAPNTVRAMVIARNSLETLRAAGFDPTEVLEQSTMRGYRGLFPVKQPRTRADHSGRDYASGATDTDSIEWAKDGNEKR